MAKSKAIVSQRRYERLFHSNASTLISQVIAATSRRGVRRSVSSRRPSPTRICRALLDAVVLDDDDSVGADPHQRNGRE